jgi:hypothetical protein
VAVTSECRRTVHVFASRLREATVASVARLSFCHREAM